MPVKAVTTSQVSRISIDLAAGTYNRLCQIVEKRNEERDNNQPVLTKAALVRGLIGSWMMRR